MNSPESSMVFVVPEIAKILRNKDATYSEPHIAHRLGGLFIPPFLDAGFHVKFAVEKEGLNPVDKAQKLKEWDETSLISQIKSRKEKEAHTQRMNKINAVLADIQN